MSAILAFENPGRPVLRGIEHFWSVIRDLDQHGAWSVQDIYLRSNVTHRATVADFVRRLVAGGFAKATGERVERRGPSQSAPTYKLCGNRPVRAPRLRRDGSLAGQGRGQQQMWNVMRGPLTREGFTYHDLALWGSTDEASVAASSAKKYIEHLATAGYLLQLHPGKAGSAAVWRLKPDMNTGPRPPLILTARIVYDQNRNSAAPFEAQEVNP